MENSKRSTERRGSFLIITLIIVIIIVIVIAGIFIALLLNSEATKITLFVLLMLLILLALGSCLFIELQRKRAIKKRDSSAQMWLQHTLEEQRRTGRSSSSTRTQINDHTSWALTTPWKHDDSKIHIRDSDCTLPPYTPPDSNRN